MKKIDRNLIYLSFFLMAVSGVAIYILENFFELMTEYGPMANPWIDEVKLIHNLGNFIFIFSVGKIFNGHILLGLKGKKQYGLFTGIGATTCILLMVFTGVLLLYLASDFRELISDFHFYIGLLLIVIFHVHLINHQLKLRKKQRVKL